MIAFDIDGCANNIKEDIMRIGKDFFAQYRPKVNAKGYYLREIFPNMPEDKYDEFWELFGYEIYTAPPKEFVFETIDFAVENGISACYITTRDVRKAFNSIYLNRITESWLEQYNIVLPVYYRKDKAAAARKLGVELIVEDKPDNIVKLQEVAEVLIYEHPYNTNMKGKFVKNWHEIYDYLERRIICLNRPG